MFDFFQKILATGSLEARYLQVIMFLDGAESLANNLMDKGHISPETVLALAMVKQAMVEEFARNNCAYTLTSIKNAVEQARSKVGEEA